MKTYVYPGSSSLVYYEIPICQGTRKSLHVDTNKYQRLDVWGRAQVVALAEEGYSSTEIAKRARKPPCGGRLGDHPKPESVRSIVQKARADPKYRGETKAGPGRNQKS